MEKKDRVGHQHPSVVFYMVSTHKSLRQGGPLSLLKARKFLLID